eukprot:1018428-Pelagomonas_calceolata.AAC.1
MEHPLSRAVCTPALPPNLVFPSSGSQMAPSNPSTRSRAAPTPVPVGLQVSVWGGHEGVRGVMGGLVAMYEFGGCVWVRWPCMSVVVV